MGKRISCNHIVLIENDHSLDSHHSQKRLAQFAYGIIMLPCQMFLIVIYTLLFVVVFHTIAGFVWIDIFSIIISQ